MSKDFIIGKLNDLLSASADTVSSTRLEDYSIILTGNKSRSFYLNKRQVNIPENTIVFIAPNCLFAPDGGAADVDMLSFSSTFYNRSHHDTQFLQNSLLFPDAGYFSFAVPVDFQVYVDYILMMLYASAKKADNSLYQNLAHNLIEQIMIQCTIHGTENKKFGYIDDADHILTTLFKDLIVRHIHQSRAVKYYADKLNITSKRLLKATQNVLGKTPKEVLTDYVLTQFKWQLIYTDSTIKEIGREYGFWDENNFSSFFSKEVGLTPTEYRRQHRTKSDE